MRRSQAEAPGADEAGLLFTNLEDDMKKCLQFLKSDTFDTIIFAVGAGLMGSIILCNIAAYMVSLFIRP
jgi:hypothetical protein